jgi:hypothetical protein
MLLSEVVLLAEGLEVVGSEGGALVAAELLEGAVASQHVAEEEIDGVLSCLARDDHGLGVAGE